MLKYELSILEKSNFVNPEFLKINAAFTDSGTRPITPCLSPGRRTQNSPRRTTPSSTRRGQFAKTLAGPPLEFSVKMLKSAFIHIFELSARKC